MRNSRLSLAIVAGAALIAIPAYAVVDPGHKGKGNLVHLTGDGIDGVNYLFGSSNTSRPPFPSSGSMFPDPSSVPELSTWMTMVMGFFAVGAIRYRSVKKARTKPE